MKYVIQWTNARLQHIYFKNISFRSSDWDAYGSTPQKIIHRTAHLSETELYETREEAEEVVLIRLDGDEHAEVIEVTDKEIFKAKLTDEAAY